MRTDCEYAYLAGKFLPRDEARLAWHDAGFVFGATVTDFCRTFRRQLYLLDEHLARFRASCAAARVPMTLSLAKLTEVCTELVAHNATLLRPGQELGMVLFATPGELAHYAGGAPVQVGPTLGVHTFPLAFSRWQRLLREGARLRVPSVPALPAACVPPTIKQRSRLHWWLAEQEVQQSDPLAQALLVDQAGNITETSVANVLVVRAGAVWSPPAQSVLPGISLRVVRDLCQALHLPWQEGPTTLEECLHADEIWLTNTSYCLVGVSRLNEQVIPFPGPRLTEVQRAWSTRVGLDITEQILADR